MGPFEIESGFHRAAFLSGTFERESASMSSPVSIGSLYSLAGGPFHHVPPVPASILPSPSQSLLPPSST